MSIISTRFLKNKKNGFFIIIYKIKNFNKIIKYIVIIICKKSAEIATLLALVIVTFLISVKSASAYQVRPSFATYAVETLSICETSQNILNEKSHSAVEISKINSNFETNYTKKILFNDAKQNIKNKNVVHNVSQKPVFSQLRMSQNLKVKTNKSKTIFFLYLVHFNFAQKIVSAFYLCLNNKTIVSLQLISCFISQNKVCLKNQTILSLQLIRGIIDQNKNSCDRPKAKKPKFISIRGSIIALNYKIGNKVFLSCDLKNHNLSCGDEGFITSVTKKSNIICVSFLLGQPLKPLDFREKLNSVVNIFVLEV